MGEDGPIFHCPEPEDSDTMCEECASVCTCEEVCPEGAIECPFEIVFEPGDGADSED
jgi:ferredoxin